MTENYVWYVCYGSNICAERFLKYLNMDSEHVTPEDLTSRPCKLPYKLFFGRQKSCTWGEGGTAFIEVDYDDKTKKKTDVSTPGRAYLVTAEQYKKVKTNEGPWYGHEIELDEIDGIKAVTFTLTKENMNALIGDGTFGNPPSDRYRSTIERGLRETYPEWNNIKVHDDGTITHD